MGKRKDTSTERFDDDGEDMLVIESPGSSHKKHKKHKKKHKKKRSKLDEELETDVQVKPAIKLKLKIGSETLGTKNVVSVADASTSEQIINVTDEPWEDGEEPAFVTKKPGEDTSDEEREWLSALEKGELNDYGEVSKKKDPSLLTARQRALKHGKQEQELMELPSGYRQVELTEEQIQRRQQRAKKRRQMAQEKREKDKKQTLERLLKKQESRLKGQKGRGSRKSDVPKLHYSNTQSGVTISVPPSVQFPFTPKIAKPPPVAVKCGVSGCSHKKKYACSKTGVPLCSLECYKKNLSLHKLNTPGLVTT